MPRRKRVIMSRLTAEALKRRAKAAGVTLPEDAWEPMAEMMTNALEPLHRFDTSANRTIEPAVTFKP
jgi:hypothetical protein